MKEEEDVGPGPGSIQASDGSFRCIVKKKYVGKTIHCDSRTELDAIFAQTGTNTAGSGRRVVKELPVFIDSGEHPVGPETSNISPAL